MYKVKRFSKCNTYQKEFAFNPVRYVVKKINPSLSDKLGNDIRRATIKNSKIISKRRLGLSSGHPTYHQSIDDNLVDLAEKNKASVINAKLGESSESFNTKVKDLPKEVLNEIKSKSPGTYSSITKNKNVIFNTKEGGIEELAHEIGHVQNRNSKNLNEKVIGELSYMTRNAGNSDRSKSGLLSSGINYLRGKVNLIEETRASKKGLRNLRDAGATSSQVRNAKNLYKENLETYGNNNEIDYKIPLKNWLDKE